MAKKLVGVNFWHLQDLIKFAGTCATQFADGRWVPARPIGWFDFSSRARAAWMVWRGRADVVIWPGDQ